MARSSSDASRSVFSCTAERVAGHYLADRFSDRHKYQRVCFEFFDSEAIDNSSSAALVRPLQYPYAKWHIWMFCICPREPHDTNTATLNDTKKTAQPCARNAVKLNCESYLLEGIMGVRGSGLYQRWEYSWRWITGN